MAVVRTYAHKNCVGCGIPLSDGYVIGCHICSERRSRRVKRGQLFTPTGFPGEWIDNQDRRGKIVGAAA